ncbi:hypothetical protein [Streptomyces sp. NBC_01361]|uniref:hypothetical protein n=1 Tax=Streptomyces sp. NBC_01361 TaxID=2903838 RepID=UPI002E38054A|nr:hypothetical protein [Streptomyces sp. NBC_01361]
MSIAILALIRPRRRGYTYGETRLQEWRRIRDFYRRSRELRKQPLPPRRAVEITGEDVKAIEALVRASDTAWSRRRSDHYRDHERFIARLYERVGAASITAVNEMTVPLFEDEITDLEGHVTVMVQQHGRPQDIADARHLLSRLHALKGRARTMEALAGIPVTRPAVES